MALCHDREQCSIINDEQSSELPFQIRCQQLSCLFIVSDQADGRETGRSKTQRRIDLKPCRFATFDSKVRCGKFEVFEDRAMPSGRKIALHVVVLPALDSKPVPDPVFFLSGGPGQGAAKIASAGEDNLMSQLRRKRDLTFIDVAPAIRIR